MTDAKLVMLSAFRQARAKAKDAPSPAEGLKLVKAFLQIDDVHVRNVAIGAALCVMPSF